MKAVTRKGRSKAKDGPSRAVDERADDRKKIEKGLTRSRAQGTSLKQQKKAGSVPAAFGIRRSRTEAAAHGQQKRTDATWNGLKKYPRPVTRGY